MRPLRPRSIVVLLLLMPLTMQVSSEPNGDLARTFPDNGPAAYILWRDAPDGGMGGIGWYDPDEPTNTCIWSQFGLSFGGGVGMYFESLRIYQNANKHVFELGEEVIVPVACPFVVARPPDHNVVGTTNFSVDVSTKIRLSVLLCVQNPFADCELVDGTEDWDLFACKAKADSGIEVLPGLVTDKPLPAMFSPGQLLEELLHGLAIAHGVTVTGSDAMYCDLDEDGAPNEVQTWDGSNPCDPDTDVCEGSDDFGHWHDATPSLNPLNRATCIPHHCPNVDQIVHVGHGTSYVLSDYEAMAFDNAGFEKGGNPFPVCAHDYFLVLDRASPDQWSTDVTDHLRGDHANRGTPEGIDALRGLFDLSLDNGCVPDVACPLDGDGHPWDPAPPAPKKREEFKGGQCTTGHAKKSNPDAKAVP